MHPASAGILRIVLHFSSEFLSSDASTLVPAGELGPDWTLPALVFAFLGQVEGMMREHPLWAAEHQSSSYAALDAAEAAVAAAEKTARAAAAAAAAEAEAEAVVSQLSEVGLGWDLSNGKGKEGGGGNQGNRGDQGGGANAAVDLASAETTRASLSLEAAIAFRAALSPAQSELDKAWESSCDELEAFVLRKISNVLLPPPPSLPVTPQATLQVEAAPRPRRPPLSASGRRLALLRWVTSSQLGVPWGGLDRAEDWAPAAAELAARLGSGTPQEKLECVHATFTHVSSALVAVLERASARDEEAKQAVKETKAAKAGEDANSEAERASVAVASGEAAAPPGGEPAAAMTAAADADSDGIAGARSGAGDDGDSERDVERGSVLSGRWSDMLDVRPNQPDLPGADDVLPASILVLLAAGQLGTLPYDPLADLDFALSYRRPGRMDSEAHYFGVTLTSALHFLNDLDGPELGLTSTAFWQRLDDEAEALGWPTGVVLSPAASPAASDRAGASGGGGGGGAALRPSIIEPTLEDVAARKKVDEQWL